MSDIGSEDMEDQGPNLGVSIFSLQHYSNMPCNRHTLGDAMKLERDMDKEELHFQMETSIMETTPVDSDMAEYVCLNS